MILYHASPVMIAQNKLTPQTRNVTMSQDGKSALLTQYDEHNKPYVFATDDLPFAAAYALPKGVRLGNYRGHDQTNILLLEKESVIGDPDLKGGVYSFDSKDFIPVLTQDGQPTNQWVTASPIHLQNEDFLILPDLNAVMKNRVQVYQIADDYSIDNFDKEMKWADNDAFLQKLKDLTEQGKLRWLNKERGINPHDCLTKTVQANQSLHEKTGPSFDRPALEI
jgi:hypothetical protein